MSGFFVFIWLYFFEKYSKFKIFILSNFIWIIGCILFSFSQNYCHLLFFTVFIGIGVEAPSILILLIIFQITLNKNQGKIISAFIAIQGFGSISGVFIAAYFEDLLHLQWNFIFFYIGLITIIWLFFTGVFLYKMNILKNIFSDKLNSLGYSFNFTKIKYILKKKPNIGLIILLIYSIPIVFFFNLWIQKYFQEYHNLTQMEAAISYIALTGSEFLGMVFGGFLYDKFYSEYHYKKFYIAIISLSISIPMFFGGFIIYWKKSIPSKEENLIDLSLNLLNYVISNNYVFISYIFLFIGFFLFALIYPFLLIIINDCNNENEVGIMLAIKNLIEVLGQAISPIIGGLISDLFSILTVMMIIPFFLIIALFNLLIIKNAIRMYFISKNKINLNNL